MPQKKANEPLTLIIVPHSERAPKSFRLPTWLFPAVGLLILISGLAFGVLAVRAYQLQVQVQALLRDRQIQLAREREMRTTIIAQQSEVQGLSVQVEGVQAELAGVRMLSDQIKGLLGLPAPTATPLESPVLAYPYDVPASRLAELELASPADNARGGQGGSTASGRSMGEAVERSQEVIEMQLLVPGTFRELLDMRAEVLQRVDRIEPENRLNATDLEKHLRLLAAAPCRWPVTARQVSSLFGYRTLLGKFEFHNGIDIPVWYGTTVRATKKGVVTQAGWQSGLGYTVEITHEMGFVTIYGHNSRLLVAVGDEVNEGDAIALSGSTGRSTGPHLHYEMRLNGAAVDPLKYLDPGITYSIQR